MMMLDFTERGWGLLPLNALELYERLKQTMC